MIYGHILTNTAIYAYMHICYHAVMKLSEYARQLDAYQAASDTIIVLETIQAVSRSLDVRQVAVYARVSAAETRPHLERQAEQLVAYCAAKGYQVYQVVKEIGSGVNDSRPKFLKLLVDPASTVIVVQQKERVTRLGFRYLDTLLALQGRRGEVLTLRWG